MWFKLSDTGKWHEVRRVLYGKSRAFCGVVMDGSDTITESEIQPCSPYSVNYCGSCWRVCNVRKNKSSSNVK